MSFYGGGFWFRASRPSSSSSAAALAWAVALAWEAAQRGSRGSYDDALGLDGGPSKAAVTDGKEFGGDLLADLCPP